ncbi:hypothetical protein AVEN_168306-1 [Araneus ventricosus]|uniref:Uncharacterized protein n=1 Tax=Araneus ventricosus TaxID=182803 RepID=A0A4Y2XA64_ARAVE|nr:hypothetical protein AVEN_93633-1 [Araneus ventricosus]GBO46505.1 hypothetical protein AVEN_168306-1 [Araneus ventricosus]
MSYSTNLPKNQQLFESYVWPSHQDANSRKSFSCPTRKKSDEIDPRSRLYGGFGTVLNFIDRTVAITRGVITGFSQKCCRWKCLETSQLGWALVRSSTL